MTDGSTFRAESSGLDIVIPLPEISINTILLETFRTQVLLEGDPDIETISPQEYIKRHNCYRALVRSTLDLGETDPAQDESDLEKITAEMVKFGREAAANSRARLIALGFPPELVDRV